MSWDVLTGDGAGNILRGWRGGRYPRGRIKDNAEDAEKRAGLKRPALHGRSKREEGRKVGTLQDKIDNMSLAKRPTEVRLRAEMTDEFKKSVMISQVAEPR